MQGNPLPRSASDNQDSLSVVTEVKALLNQLTMESFDSISDQIISWVNKAEDEHWTLIQVILLAVRTATDDGRLPAMYARFFLKLIEQISPKIQDETIKTADGKPIAGGQLVRRYLLDICQEEFERGWTINEAGEGVRRGGNEVVRGFNGARKVPKWCSDEIYAADKARRQGLALIQLLKVVIELRSRHWVSRNAVDSMTISSRVHDNALGTRHNNTRLNDRVSLGSSTKGDLSNFGTISKAQSISFGPVSVFSKGPRAEKREPLSRAAGTSSSHMIPIMTRNHENQQPNKSPLPHSASKIE